MSQRLRLKRRICSEIQIPPILTAEARIYELGEIQVNPHGAVSVLTEFGYLGVKPGEFEWIGWDGSPTPQPLSRGASERRASVIAKCPTCDSPHPVLHPAVQFEGEVQPCRDPWHGFTATGEQP